MAAIFKPLRGSRFRAACGASCAAQCVLRLLPTHSNLYALGPGEIGSRPVVCGAGPQGERASSKGRSGCFRWVFLSSYSIIQYLFSSYFSSYSSSYSRFCWQGHKKQACCDSILKIKNILSFFATHRKLGSRGPASKIVNKNWNKNWNKN